MLEPTSSSNGSTSARISLISEPGCSSSQFLKTIPQVDPSQVEIAPAEIMISLPARQTRQIDTSSKSSNRGRPNKFVVLDNGEIVRQNLPKKAEKEPARKIVIKQEIEQESPAKGPGRKRKKQREVDSLADDESDKESSGPTRRTTRKSAGRNSRYNDFEDESNDGDFDTENFDLPGVTIKKVDAPSKQTFIAVNCIHTCSNKIYI